MKTTLTIIAMFLATPVISKEEGEHICETLGDVAYKVMELRQGGVPMSTVMQRFSAIKKLTPDKNHGINYLHMKET